MGHKIYFTTFFCIDGRVRGWLGRPALKWFSLLSGLSPLSHLSVGKRLTLKKEVPFLRRNSRCWLKMLAGEMQPQNRMDARRPSKACMSLHSYDNCYSCVPHTLTLALVTTEEGQERQS